MKIKLLLTIIFLNLFTISFGQPNAAWDKWNWLIGEWKGEGSGQPGQGEGTFSFKPDLDNKVLIRRNHSVYPAKENKPGIIHDDLMIVYKDYSGHPAKAIYFDNEGHTINYLVSFTDSSVILTSEKMPNAPVFRLSYLDLKKDRVNVKFEMSRDGEKFTIYTEGTCNKIK